MEVEREGSARSPAQKQRTIRLGSQGHHNLDNRAGSHSNREHRPPVGAARADCTHSAPGKHRAAAHSWHSVAGKRAEHVAVVWALLKKNCRRLEARCPVDIAVH